MLLTVLIVAISAYSISRIKWRYKNSFLYSLLLLHSIPLSTTMVPIYGIMRTLHLRNSYLGLILVYTAMQLPFLIWLMKGFFDTIPEELEEASWIDGCTSLKALFKVILPISLPGILVVSALSFLGAWGESMLILILVDSEKMKTVPLVFYEAIRTVGGYMEVRYELVSSFAILFQIPVVILFILSRKLLATSIVPGVER
jgi:multiple sugar transport system permease protein